MKYSVNVRKTEANAKCRICRKQIARNELASFCTGQDDWNRFQAICHTDCFLRLIIRKTKDYQIEMLRKELEKFDRIEKLLSPPVKKRRNKKEVPHV
jgi:hypothetical protein